MICVQMEAPRLVRAIGRWDLTAGIVNGVIGAGIFGSPSEVARLLGVWSPLAFVLGAFGILTVILCFAEVGSRFEETGGPYLYVREAFGGHLGFQVGWLHVWTRILSGAALLNVFVSYFGRIVPWVQTAEGRTIVMTVVVFLITAVNVWGLRQAVWAVNALTVAKLLPLFALIALGLPRISGDVLAAQPVTTPHWADAILLVVFAYAGFESGVVAASETHNPRRDTAFALLAGLAMVTLVYCLVQLVVVGVLPSAQDTKTAVASALTVLVGPGGAIAGSLAAMLSCYGWLTSLALMTPRILFSMGERRELPSVLGRVHPRFRTPHVAVIVNSLAVLALALAGTFVGTANLSVVTRLPIYLLVCATLVVLRRREREGGRVFRVAGGAAVAAAGIAFCLWLLSTRSRAEFLGLLGIMAAGLVVRFVAGRAATRVTLAG